ncbi:hypothetical protein [Brevundimonas sp.]
MPRTILALSASIALLTGSPAFAAAETQMSPTRAGSLQAIHPNLGDAFQVAWGGSVAEEGLFVFTAAFSQLHAIGQDRYALVSTAYAHSWMGHHVEQALAVRYLRLTPTGYEAMHAPTAMVSDLTFGSVTWSVRDDLLDDPVLVAEFPSGGDRPSSPTNIGVYLIVLESEGPVVRSERIPLSCGLDLRFLEDDRIKGELSASADDGIVVTYTGTHSATMTYTPNAEGILVAVSDAADLKWCGLL